jgi:hypothetical protein
MEVDDGRREWSNELRAESRRVAGRPKSRWLVEDRGGGPTSWGRGDGASNGPSQAAGESSMQGPNKINVPNNTFNNIIIANQNSQNIPIIPCPNPVGQLAIFKESQSLPNNTLNVSIPPITFPCETASTLKPGVKQHLSPPITTFNASANVSQVNTQTPHVNYQTRQTINTICQPCIILCPIISQSLSIFKPANPCQPTNHDTNHF